MPNKLELEIKIVKRFIDLIGNKDKIVNPLFNRVQVYQDMVYFRFYETISNLLPLSCKTISQKKLKKWIFEFINNKPSSPYMWKIPYEFSSYILTTKKLKNKKFLKDLLWFEYTEIDLRMFNYTHKKVTFNWDSKLSLSPSVRLKELNYAVYKRDYKNKGKYPILFYYDFDDHKIKFNEITPFMYQFLKNLGSKTVEENVIELASLHNIEVVDLKEVMLKQLKILCKLKVLI